MTKVKIFFLFIFIGHFSGLFSQTSCCSKAEDEKILGQAVPGKIPVLFTPKVKAFKDYALQRFTLSPKGDEIFFVVPDTSPKKNTMHYSIKKEGTWSKPEIAGFIENGNGTLPEFSHDGNKLFFHSSGDLWVTRKTEKGWGAAEKLPNPISSEFYECGVSVSAKGNLYFASNGRPENKSKQCDIFCAKKNGDGFGAVTHLPINDESSECVVSVSPDERFLLMSRYRGERSTDIYICYKKDDESWSQPIVLGPMFNTVWADSPLKFSPDGKSFFFQRFSKKDDKNIYEMFWVSTTLFDDYLALFKKYENN